MARVFVFAHVPQYESLQFDVTRSMRCPPTSQDPWECVASPAPGQPLLDDVIRMCATVLKAANSVILSGRVLLDGGDNRDPKESADAVVRDRS